MTKASWRAKIFSFSSFFLGIVVLVLAVSKLRINNAGATLSLQNREKRRAEEKLRFQEENDEDEEGSTSWIEDYYDSREVILVNLFIFASIDPSFLGIWSIRKRGTLGFAA